MGRKTLTKRLVAIWGLILCCGVLAGLFLGVGFLILVVALFHLYTTTAQLHPRMMRLLLGQNLAEQRESRLTAIGGLPRSYRIHWIVSNVLWFGLAIFAILRANVRLTDLLMIYFR